MNRIAFSRQFVPSNTELNSSANPVTGDTPAFPAGSGRAAVEMNTGIVPAAPADDLVAELQEAFQLESRRADFFFDSYGVGEKWIYGDSGGQSRVYFIAPNGDLFNWDRTPGRATGEFVGNVGVDTWELKHTTIRH